MTRFRYKLKAEHSFSKCVFRMNFGSKYFIWKSPELKKTLDTLCRDLDRKSSNGCKETDLFCKLATYCARYRTFDFEVQVLLESEDNDAILFFEKKMLKQSESDNNCLNSVFEPWVPKWIDQPAQNKPLKRTISPDAVKEPIKKDEIKPEPAKEPEQPIIAHVNTPSPKKKYDLKAMASALKNISDSDAKS